MPLKIHSTLGWGATVTLIEDGKITTRTLKARMDQSNRIRNFKRVHFTAIETDNMYQTLAQIKKINVF